MNSTNFYPTSENKSFNVFYKEQIKSDVPLHVHPQYEMNFVISGNGQRHVGDNIENFEEGDLILLAPNIPHRWENQTSEHRTYSSLVIHWGSNFLGNALQQTPELQEIHKLFDRSGYGIQFDKYVAKQLHKNKDSLLQASPFKRLTLFLELLNDLAQASDYRTLSTQGSTNLMNKNTSRLETVFSFVEEHYPEKITLNEIADLVNMSDGAFSRYFSKEVRKPFFSFLNEYRIEMACILLKQTEKNVNEIAFATGYESIQFFYRQFSKYKKCSPTTYRKALGII